MTRHLYQARKRIREKAVKAAGGQSISLTKVFSSEARAKISWAMTAASPAEVDPAFSVYPSWIDVAVQVQRLLLEEWGRMGRLYRVTDLRIDDDVTAYLTSKATDDEVVDMIEAWFLAVPAAFRATRTGAGDYLGFEAGTRVSGLPIQEQCFDVFRVKVNDMFDLEDMAYQVVGTEVIERESMVMHADVVAPVLALLHGDTRLAAVERAYQAALRELKPGGDPADAITDAATALQEMLNVLGVKGNSLGPQIKDAVRTKILRPYDAKLVDWASAARSDRGDAHSSSAASRDEAWLAVHVAGALLLYLERHL